MIIEEFVSCSEADKDVTSSEEQQNYEIASELQNIGKYQKYEKLIKECIIKKRDQVKANKICRM